MPKVTQPTPLPTNKVSAATITVFVMELSRVIVSNFWPGFYDPNLWAAATVLITPAVAYFVKDEANV